MCNVRQQSAREQQGLCVAAGAWCRLQQLSNVPFQWSSERAWCSSDDANLNECVVATNSWLCQSPATAGMARHVSMGSQTADS